MKNERFISPSFQVYKNYNICINGGKGNAQEIKNAYWEACSDVLYWFIEKYFGLDLRENVDFFVVGSDSITGVVAVHDYFIGWGDIEQCLINDVPIEKFNEWLGLLDEYSHNTPMNFNSFIMGLCVKDTTKQKKASTTKTSTESRKQKGGKK